MIEAGKFWRKCSTCKREITYSRKYWVCNVSTCNRKRTGVVFCCVSCWDAHNPIMNHRDSWALEKQAPTQDEWARELNTESGLISTVPAVFTSKAPPQGFEKGAQLFPSKAPVSSPVQSIEYDVLVVASKVKAYIRERSEMNTAANVMDELSDHVRRWAVEGIESARRDNRKTVMERDF